MIDDVSFYLMVSIWYFSMKTFVKQEYPSMVYFISHDVWYTFVALPDQPPSLPSGDSSLVSAFTLSRAVQMGLIKIRTF